MKKLLFLFFTLSVISANAQQFRYGFGFSLQKTWWVPEGDLYAITEKFPRIQYGLILDQTIGSGEHLAITTGLRIDYTQCGMYALKENGQGTDKQWTIRNRYLEIPLSLRLRTGQTGSFVFYGEGGVVAGKCVRSRGDFDQNGIRYDTDINYLQNENPNGMNSTQSNAGITFGAGTEISVTETASIMLGFFYTKGMADVLEDNNETNNIMMDQMGIHILGLF